MQKRRSSSSTMVSTNKIVRFPGVSEQTFLRVMREEIMSTIPVVDTGAIFIGWQELVKDETDSSLGGATYLWHIHWHGFHRPALVRKESERIFEMVRPKIAMIGVRTGLNITMPLRERCVLHDGQWVVHPK